MMTIFTMAAMFIHAVFGCCSHHAHAHLPTVASETPHACEHRPLVDNASHQHERIECAAASVQSTLPHGDIPCPCESCPETGCSEGQCQFLQTAPVKSPGADQVNPIASVNVTMGGLLSTAVCGWECDAICQPRGPSAASSCAPAMTQVWRL